MVDSADRRRRDAATYRQALEQRGYDGEDAFLNVLLSLAERKTDCWEVYNDLAAHAMQSGETRLAQAELCSEIQFVRKNPGYAKFALELELPDPFFYGTEKTADVRTGSISPIIWTHVNAGSAPATYMVITLEGPLSNPILRNRNNGIWIQYVGTIASGQAVVLDTKYYTCLQGDQNMISIVKHGGDAYWMILDAGENSLELETETIGGSIMIQYYPAYF